MTATQETNTESSAQDSDITNIETHTESRAQDSDITNTETHTSENSSHKSSETQEDFVIGQEENSQHDQTEGLAIDVAEILEKAKPKHQTSKVSKHDDLSYDLGNLCSFDFHPIQVSAFHQNGESFLRSSIRDNVQLLFNKIFSLQARKLDTGAVVAKLPSPTTPIPREKPVPKPKPLTRWQKFAQLKGIKKRRRPKLVWDEATGEWRRRWGIRRANDPKDVWLVEAKASDEVGTDPFIQAKHDRKERKQKQRKQQIQNIKYAEKAELKKLGPVLDVERDINPYKTRKNPRKDVEEAVKFANKSTASIGKFDKKLPGQKPFKVIEHFEPVTEARGNQNEKSRSLDVLKKILGHTDKKQPVNTQKAANQYQTKENKKTAIENLKKPSVPFKKRGQDSTRRTPSKKKTRSFQKFVNN